MSKNLTRHLERLGITRDEPDEKLDHAAARCRAACVLHPDLDTLLSSVGVRVTNGLR